MRVVHDRLADDLELANVRARANEVAQAKPRAIHLLLLAAGFATVAAAAATSRSAATTRTTTLTPFC